MRPAVLRNPAARIAAFAAVCVVLVLGAGRAAASGVASALTPTPDFVAPGATFEVDLVVPAAGAAFNGFHAVIGYDPAALAFVQAIPLSAQVGCLMNGGCSAACGATFHIFQAAGDSLVADLSLLCDQVQLNGPGQVYRLQFAASESAQVTWVRTRYALFYSAGIQLAPGATADARIVIGSPAGVAGEPFVRAWRVVAEPNPSRGAVSLTVSAPADGEQVLDVIDLAGRVVRRLAGGWRRAGSRDIAWDGTGADGARLPAGVYLVRLRAGSHLTTTRLTLLP